MKSWTSLVIGLAAVLPLAFAQTPTSVRYYSGKPEGAPTKTGTACRNCGAKLVTVDNERGHSTPITSNDNCLTQTGCNRSPVWKVEQKSRLAPAVLLSSVQLVAWGPLGGGIFGLRRVDDDLTAHPPRR